MKLAHPDDPKRVIETNEPEAYLSQGWVESSKKSDSDDR